MNVKFRVILEDQTVKESHDEMYNLKLDHSHVLAEGKKWLEYHIVSDEGHLLAVNFMNGVFVFKSPGMFYGLQPSEELNKVQGVEVQPADEEGEVYTFDDTPQKIESDSPWSVNDGLPYLPVVGRRIYKGDLRGAPIDQTVFYCGWVKKFGDKEVKKVASLWPNGKISFT